MAKRTFDLVLSIIGLIVFSPLLLITGVVILATLGWPVLYSPQRAGRSDTLFTMRKFRSMKNAAGPTSRHSGDDDPRVTTVGRWIRKFKLDELPQLINILRGDLSFVGPRPALYNQDDLIESRTAAGVHRIPPGLTGWAQVSGRDELPIPVKVEFDAYYLEHRSMWFDIRILFMTFFKVLRNEGVSH